MSNHEHETEQPPKPEHSLVRHVLLGAFWGNAGMFLVAPIVAVLYQFPMYPYGTIGGLTIGWDQMIFGVWLTVLVGFVEGGFVVLGILGAVAGAVSYKVFGKSADNLYWRTIGCALVVDVVVIAVVLAVVASAADVLAQHLASYW